VDLVDYSQAPEPRSNRGPQRGFASLSDFQGAPDPEDDDPAQNMFAGGEKS
jgi:hypothetical protein